MTKIRSMLANQSSVGEPERRGDERSEARRSGGSSTLERAIASVPPDPEVWTYFYLYVILDIFSRYVVGWMVAPRESAALAERLIRETCAKQASPRGS